MAAIPRRIGIIGSGPMAGYTLLHLLNAGVALSITIFEADCVAGCGSPYREGVNGPEMYCNAFSREIPAYTQHLSTWLKQQPAAFLDHWGLAPDDIDARSFYPRLLLGKYFEDEFASLCAKARTKGHEVSVYTQHRVTDVRPAGREIVCSIESPSGTVIASFENVIIATGHSWPDAPQIDGADLVSPWPYKNMTKLPAQRLGILGSSLSAIDALVTLAVEHGEFADQNGHISWFPNQSAEGLHITMVSRNGIMPEPDFHYPFPYEALRHITPEAVRKEIRFGSDGLLKRVFALLRQELHDAAPEYLTSLGSDAETIEGFARAYFRCRQELGGLRALAAALQAANQSFETKTTQPERYALLRSHENFEPVLSHLSASDMETFRGHLAPVFADCYAAIPHISVRRVLALYDAGVLDLLPIAEGASFSEGPEGISVETIDGPLSVTAMIDARGQATAPLGALAFPTLVTTLVDPDSPLQAPYRLDLKVGTTAHVYCLAMPQILAQNPFAQGLENCHEISRIAVEHLLRDGAENLTPG